MRDVEAMRAELEEIKSELQDFGPEGFYAVPYTTIKRDFPTFTKSIIEAFLKSMDFVDAKDLEEPANLDDAWMNKELILEEDWPMLIYAAENYYIPNKELPAWDKLLAIFQGESFDDPAAEPEIAEDEVDDYTEELEEDNLDENVNINVSADDPLELVQLAKAVLGGDFDVFDQDFDAPVENIPAAELEAGFEVEADKEPVEYKDPFEENPFDDAPVEPVAAEKIEEPAEEPQDASAEEDSTKVSEDEPQDDIPEEPVETELDKEMAAKAEEKPADEQPMDMIDGKLVPAKDPKESEVEVEEDVDEGFLSVGPGIHEINSIPQKLGKALDTPEGKAIATAAVKAALESEEPEEEGKFELEESADEFDDFDTQVQSDELIPDDFEEEMSDEEFAEAFKQKLDEAGFGTKEEE